MSSSDTGWGFLATKGLMSLFLPSTSFTPASRAVHTYVHAHQCSTTPQQRATDHMWNVNTEHTCTWPRGCVHAQEPLRTQRERLLSSGPERANLVPSLNSPWAHHRKWLPLDLQQKGRSCKGHPEGTTGTYSSQAHCPLRSHTGLKSQLVGFFGPPQDKHCGWGGLFCLE